MELIYADHNKYALGQLNSFDIDFDATEEKNFELVIDEALLQKDYWFFIPNTEIGGIVDSITVNTEDNSVKYEGRNFRGILNDKIIDVPRGFNYVSAQGDIDDEINELLAAAELSEHFECLPPATENVDTWVDIAFEPFCTLYDGIMALASFLNLKLIFAYNVVTNKVEITPMLTEDYTDYLTYTKNSSINLELQDNAMATNHFKLVGYGEDNARYQIDLFVNENAQIMDYANVFNPIKDSQYILDNRNQQFFGIDEKTEVQITDSLSPIENYEIVSSKPSDWNTNYASYYLQTTTADNNDEVEINYESVEPLKRYRALSSQPSDWSVNYESYFEFKDGEYRGISGTATENEAYKVVKKKPKSWKENYGEYYYRETDGLTYFYASINGKTKNYYKKQKFKPTDWNTNCNSYYKVEKKNGKTKYVTVKASDKGKSPKWKKYKYYTKLSVTYAPSFSARTVYCKIKTTSSQHAPSFVSGEVYQEYNVAPYFTTCYRKVYDHYGGMISKLLEDLEIFPVNRQEVSIVDFEADIGDVVGGYDAKTNITMSAPITNVIYRIERGVQRSIEYVLGG